jgi:hypothetical protein
MKLTKWYPSDIKPVRCGVYQVAYFGRDKPSYCRWNGNKWMASFSISDSLVEDSFESAKLATIENMTQTLEWRGWDK